MEIVGSRNLTGEEITKKAKRENNRINDNVGWGTYHNKRVESDDDELAFLDSIPGAAKTGNIAIDNSSSDNECPQLPLSQTLEAVRNLREQVKKKQKLVPNSPEIIISADPKTVQLILKNAKISYKLSVNREDPFLDLKKIISKVTDIPEALLHFKYDGIPLGLSETPKSYSMEDDDVINFEMIQELPTTSKLKHMNPELSTWTTSLDKSNQLNLKNVPPEPDITEKELEKEISQKIESAIQTKLKADEEAKINAIKLSVRTDSNQQTFKFKIQKTDPFLKIITAVATKQNILPEKIKLKFEGETLSPSSTPNDFDMENGDLIDVHIN